MIPTPIETINVGFGNVVSAGRIVVVCRTGSSPIRRLIEAAERDNRLIDATSGRRTRSIIVTNSNHVVLSHVQPRTLAQKMAGVELPDDPDADEQDDDDA